VPDAHESFRQYVQQEAPEELLDVQGHETLLVLVCRVAPAESDFVAGKRDEPVVRDANPVRVAAEVAQSVFRSAEGTL